jgi:creatinine amidohydrolase/Fe(II)-dependent formamide hydrolase-like protein
MRSGSAGVAAAEILRRGAAAAEPAAGASARSHKYEDLLPEDFYAELERAPIAYCGCGSMEEHGLQNALGTDLFQAYEICLRAVQISGGFVFPPVPFAMAYPPPGLSRRELRQQAKPIYPPSLWLSGDLCRQIYTELLESLADLGFKSCIAFGGHMPADTMLQQIDNELGGRIGAMRFWGGGTESILRDFIQQIQKEKPLSGGHGMMWETSITMALNPKWVDLPRARRIPTHRLPSQLKKQPQERIDYIGAANPELGNRMLNLAAERAAKLAQEMLKQGGA